MTPGQQRILDAARRLAYHGDFIYDRPRGTDTPIPTCAGCDASNWRPAHIQHRPDCAVEELVAAVRALGQGEMSDGT